jgi:hypothetical protein
METRLVRTYIKDERQWTAIYILLQYKPASQQNVDGLMMSIQDEEGKLLLVVMIPRILPSLPRDIW